VPSNSDSKPSFPFVAISVAASRSSKSPHATGLEAVASLLCYSYRFTA
jgi:hypothetical protein